MFFLLTLRDTIKISPRKFEMNVRDMIQDQIHSKYSNKVIPGEGLCLFVHSIKEIGNCNLHVSFGEGFFKVTFVLVVFRGVTYEIMKGTVDHIDGSGVRVKIPFFKDIYIPPQEMPTNTVYAPKNNTWVWEYDVENDVCGYIKVGDEVKFTCLNSEYESVDSKTLEHRKAELNVMDAPPPPPLPEPEEGEPRVSAAEMKKKHDEEKKQAAALAARKPRFSEKPTTDPAVMSEVTMQTFIIHEKKAMKIRASFHGVGCGPLNWWKEANLFESAE